MTHNIGGFLNHLQRTLNYKSMVKEVHGLDLPSALWTSYDISVLKLLQLPHSFNEDVTLDNIDILVKELRLKNARTLVEGIKKLWWQKTSIRRVPKGVQLLLLTCCIASCTEAICETLGSVMEMCHKTQFFRSPGNNDLSCQKHVFIAMNGPQITHCKSLIDWLCDEEFKDLKLCTRSYEKGKMGTVLSHIAQETDSKRRRTKPFSLRDNEAMLEDLQRYES